MDDTNNAKGNGSFGEKLLSENEDLVTQNLIEDNYETESSLEELLIEDEFDNTSVFHTQKKFVQNLKDINFEEDSDDDNEWNPNEEEDEANELSVSLRQAGLRQVVDRRMYERFYMLCCSQALGSWLCILNKQEAEL